jgi:hypothetical protein
MNLHVTVDADTPRGDYLAAAARIRRLSSSHLLRIVVDKLLDDQLILAVMDDDSKPYPPNVSAAQARARQQHGARMAELMNGGSVYHRDAKGRIKAAGTV